MSTSAEARSLSVACAGVSITGAETSTKGMYVTSSRVFVALSYLSARTLLAFSPSDGCFAGCMKLWHSRAFSTSPEITSLTRAQLSRVQSSLSMVDSFHLHCCFGLMIRFDYVKTTSTLCVACSCAHFAFGDQGLVRATEEE